MQQHRVMQVNFIGNGNGATHTAIILILLPLTADCRYLMFMFIDLRSGECGVMQVNIVVAGGATHTLIVDS